MCAGTPAHYAQTVREHRLTVVLHDEHVALLQHVTLEHHAEHPVAGSGKGYEGV